MCCRSDCPSCSSVEATVTNEVRNKRKIAAFACLFRKIIRGDKNSCYQLFSFDIASVLLMSDQDAGHRAKWTTPLFCNVSIFMLAAGALLRNALVGRGPGNRVRGNYAGVRGLRKRRKAGQGASLVCFRGSCLLCVCVCVCALVWTVSCLSRRRVRESGRFSTYCFYDHAYRHNCVCVVCAVLCVSLLFCGCASVGERT